jgi:thiol:disulfide interchange protein
MRYFRTIFVLFAALAAGMVARAASSSADAPHLHVQLVAPVDEIYPGGDNQIGLYFKLEQGWHVYWKNAGDSGEPPHIQWTLPDGVTAEPMQFPAPTRLPLGPLMDFGYENEVLFPIKLDVATTAKSGKAVLDAKVDWLVCREVCIPGKADLQLMLQLFTSKPPVIAGSAQDAALMKRLASTLPQPLPENVKAVFQQTSEGFRLGIETGKRESTAQFFPSDQDWLANAAPQKATPTAKGVVLDLKKDVNFNGNPKQLSGVLELSGGRAYDVTVQPGTVLIPAEYDLGMLAKTFSLAFIGGLLLNLMPCVFPVLFLKGLALCRSGVEERHRLRAHGFVYAVGILVSFWILVAALLGLRAAGASLGWGFQFQSPVFLALMAGLLFFLGLSLAGQFEIGLSLTSAGSSLAVKKGYAGSFFTGVLAVIVATPCTAPFMGAAIGYALSQSAVVTFCVFTAIALGLAAPYVALTLQPAWTRLLPQPGQWMEILRQAVSVPIFGTVIWLALVIAQAYGAAVLGVLLVCFLLLAIAGWFLGHWPAKRWATVVASVIVLLVVGISVYAPGKLAAQPAMQSGARSQQAWEPWSPDAVRNYRAQGRPVLVDFTASWCLSCQVNERVALSRPEVQQALQSANVALLRADWTRHDQAITEALAALDRSGVPAYALYVPGQSEPQMLPEVLTPGIVIDAVNKLPVVTSSASPTSNTDQAPTTGH